MFLFQPLIPFFILARSVSALSVRLQAPAVPQPIEKVVDPLEAGVESVEVCPETSADSPSGSNQASHFAIEDESCVAPQHRRTVYSRAHTLRVENQWRRHRQTQLEHLRAGAQAGILSPWEVRETSEDLPGPSQGLRKMSQCCIYLRYVTFCGSHFGRIIIPSSESNVVGFLPDIPPGAKHVVFVLHGLGWAYGGGSPSTVFLQDFNAK
jgi:hypothetical protein